ncbi:MAG TPA: hypothetical protein VHI99_10035 [Vicinamibacterales bacterium]|nr:hypothetical protein [Vicinamibacterales bacterium]
MHRRQLRERRHQLPSEFSGDRLALRVAPLRDTQTWIAKKDIGGRRSAILAQP